jgi:divalent metal cation (Fe/Co/Zn/Cd) transporter
MESSVAHAHPGHSHDGCGHQHRGASPDADPALLRRWRHQALALSWLSLVLITAEGAIGIGAGIAAGSIALVAFGLDSAIEGLASVTVIWRFTGDRKHSAEAEVRAQKLVGLSFGVLAPYVAFVAIHKLVTGERPEESTLGIALTIASLIVMPTLGIAKKRVGARLHSAATRSEGAQNLICTYMAAGVLAGLLANAFWGLWWLDPVVALGIAGLAVVEARRAWRGEDCGCAASPLAP